jgi:hypothetical protein
VTVGVIAITESLCHRPDALPDQVNFAPGTLETPATDR